jgi:hypothetical protein
VKEARSQELGYVFAFGKQARSMQVCMHVRVWEHGHLVAMNFATPHSALPPELYNQTDNI